ncbi:hypothetical protein [Bradyrhizobium sp. CCGUVB23]|uniref:hypothetical protein n=1 Tax=Bradyrhizobium sp. CCGUVB23 TaxID=2949630 RepID=UPI0020B2D9F6|nr:hypothetical protein [Bradyrhizobium sp. CCGUVB23]MCP3463621.1 hypothetical protein [Bradyrhizobium sp. CCGUVB23]
MIDGATHEDEATVVVAVRRRKAPCPATAFDGEGQENAMFVDDATEHGIDQGDFLADHLGRNVSQTHPARPKSR